MGKCCDIKAITKKIRVGNTEIPIRGLEPIMFMVSKLHYKNDILILERLIKEITELGNPIPAEKEKDYKAALLYEYKEFVFNRVLIKNTGRK